MNAEFLTCNFAQNEYPKSRPTMGPPSSFQCDQIFQTKNRKKAASTDGQGEGDGGEICSNVRVFWLYHPPSGIKNDRCLPMCGHKPKMLIF